MLDLLQKSFFETLVMVSFSTMISFFVGGGIALCLWITKPNGLRPQPLFYSCLSFIINAGRSIPYIIFMVLLIPITRLLAGSSIGTMAATVPLSFAGILLFARLMEEALMTVPHSLIEVGKVMGATHYQIIQKIVLREALPSIVANLTSLIIMLIGFSAMAGAVGGGGLGDLAIRYGYQRYDVVLLIVIVCVLITMVQIIQYIGDKTTLYLRK